MGKEIKKSSKVEINKINLENERIQNNVDNFEA